MADQDLPPATPDGDVQNFLDVKWREAVRAATEGMEALRSIWPELTQHIPETGSNFIKRSLDDFEGANYNLQRAGVHVLGQERYDEFCQARVERQIGR